jgi:hypothetical protein
MSERLLIVVMVVVAMVMMTVHYHDDLCLRGVRCSEAEDENRSKQKLFHTLL